MSGAGRIAAVVVAELVVAGCLGVSPASVPPSPSPSPTLPPSVSAPCAVAEQSGVLPSDRLVDLEAGPGTGTDVLVFEFEPDPAGRPGRGTLRAAEPPFEQGGSGERVDVAGERHLEIRFEGVVIADDAGNPVYRGPRDLRPELPALRHVVVTDQFEGVTTFVVGYDGPGCVTLAGDAATGRVVVAIGATPAP